IAGRLGIKIGLERFDALGRETPMLVDLKPSGQHYMQELHAAGGFSRIRAELRDHLDLDCLSVDGMTQRDLLEAAPEFAQDVVRPLADPLYTSGSMAVLKGNLCPDGAVIKQAAASERLLRHEGRAVVFENVEDLARRIDDPNLEVDEDDVLIMRNAGPIGAPGMPEAGYLPIPKKLASKGVKDMVRISDARMSGTAFGTIVLHVAPEAAAGGPLALARTGDLVRLDVPARRLDLLVDDAELERRRRQAAEASAKPSRPARGYARLLHDEILQAPEGCDFRFLRGRNEPSEG
ncbi:MAG: dihydroxy-acid dehydratase, partial [Geminicoccaceae bacterium]|nr:dihydroxy-acid dehydratase [Geminicoccaceae bacterium]